MEINLVELWERLGMPVRCVVLVLTVQALACMTVFIDRMIVLLRSGARARVIAEKLQPLLERGEFNDALVAARPFKGDQLGSYLLLGIETFTSRLRGGDTSEQAADLTRRALQRKGDVTSRELNRGMNVLASTGSTAPFVGLLGTVLGIINAFKLIAASGSGGVGAIGGAIGEALVVTGYGLVVAIPSVLLFNWLNARISSYEIGMFNAGSELVDRFETAGRGQLREESARSDTRATAAAAREAQSAFG